MSVKCFAALDETSETGQTRMMPAPVMPHGDATEDSSLTDTQVLRYLEVRRSDSDGRGGGRFGRRADRRQHLATQNPMTRGRGARSRTRLLATRRCRSPYSFNGRCSRLSSIKCRLSRSSVPTRALHRGRQPRGTQVVRSATRFFSDAISAKQVAYYVRSEFASVAVVPVSPQEKTRATDEDRKSGASLAFPKRARQEPIEEFKLIDSDDGGAQAAPRVQQRVASKPTAVPAAAARSAPPQPTTASAKRNPPPRGGGRVGARERRGPQTLEETLEILGAGELEVDNGSGETLNDTGVRHLRVEVQKNTPFSRLLERLSERSKKN